MRVAAAQYPIEQHRDFAGYAAKVERWIADAAARGCALAVFPEYGSMELGSLMPPDVQRDPRRQRHAIQAHVEPFRALHARLSREHGMWIAAASIPVERPDGSFCNRVHVYGPAGETGFADKQIMTRFEREDWLIDPAQGPAQGSAQRPAQPAQALPVFDTGATVFGISVCYDVEFPLLARRLVEGGARVLLVPSCTDTEAGAHRVRLGARARALENQCYAVHAVTWGQAPWSAAVDVNTGCAAVYGPIDRGFPDDGILASQPADQPGWLVADLDLEALDAVRRDGQVTNDRDWPVHVAAARAPVTRIGPGKDRG
jgi:predicted amidohydrolase